MPVEAPLPLYCWTNVSSHRLSLRHVPDGKEQVGAGAVQRAGRLHSDAVGRAGDEHHLVLPLTTEPLVVDDLLSGGSTVARPCGVEVGG